MEKNTFDFSDALRLLKEGKKVYRTEWTENCYIYLVKGSVFEVSRPPLNDALPAGTKVIYGPHIDMLQKFPTGEICAWVWRASNLDMLTDDWHESAIGRLFGVNETVARRVGGRGGDRPALLHH